MPLSLQNERLRLRQYSFDDAARIAQLCADFSLKGFFLPDESPNSIEQANLYISRAIQENENNNQIVYGIELIKHHGIIGEIRINVVDKTLSYWLGAEFRGQGYTVDAIELITYYGYSQLNFQKIDAYVDRQNIASRKILEIAGFRFQSIYIDYTHTIRRQMTFLMYTHFRPEQH